MEQYQVTGMSCAACSARVEKAVSKVDGVTACTVNLLTHSMEVEGTADSETVIAAVVDAGYGAHLLTDSAPDETDGATILFRRFVKSLAFLLVLMYLSMGHHMWGWPLPAFLTPFGGWLQLLLSAVVMVINRTFFIDGFRSLFRKSPNMNTLVACGSAAAFLYSTASLLLSRTDFYFESAAMILTLITLGKFLEERSKGKTTDAIRGLMSLAPATATLWTEEGERVVPVSRLQQGDIFILRSGDRIPADGIVIEGHATVDESALTGESLPVDKPTDATLTAGTVCLTGYVRCRALRVGEDTTLSEIIRTVRDASASKAPIAKTADRVAGVFVPAVLGIALVTLLGWLMAGQTFGFALARAVSVLVISCPCALGLATPVAIMVGNGVAAKHGILFKTATALETAGRVKTVVLDKTGTLTAGKPAVTDLIPNGITADELLTLAYALEYKSEHPLARALVKTAEEKALPFTTVTDFETFPGRGVAANCNGTRLIGGNRRFLEEEGVKADFPATSGGQIPLYFARDGVFLGTVCLADTLLPDSPSAVAELRKMGLQVVLLTGDRTETAQDIAQKSGIERVVAQVLPDEKAAHVQAFRQDGRVMMVGDGINDAPALKSADVGVAIGAGADIAMDAADVVLVNSRLTDVVTAIRLSRRILTNIRENLFWAFFYNTIGIPLAAGLFIPALGWELNPMFGAAAMSLSSVCVVSNALRLNRFKTTRKEEKQMEKIIGIEGMMCPHCEAHVRNALLAIDGVVEATASHTEKRAVVKLSKDLPDEVLHTAITNAGYTVVK